MTTLAISNSVAPGTLGFIVVFSMAVVLTFLFRSMSKHLRKVDDAARRDEEAASPAAASTSAVKGPDARGGAADAASTSSGDS